MPRLVMWRLRFKADGPADVTSALEPFLKAVPAAVVTSGPQHSVEGPEFWEVRMTTEFASPPARGVLRLLQAAAYLASGWLVYGPDLQREDDEVLLFSGVFRSGQRSRANVWGLDKASFSFDGHGQEA